METITTVSHNRNEQIGILAIISGMMAMLLHHAQIMYGLNLSLADGLSTLILGLLIASGRLRIPVFPMLFFTVISILVICTSMFLTPFSFSNRIDYLKIAVDYLKLLTVFMYFIIGHNASRWDLTRVLKVYCWFGVAVASLGTLFTLWPVSLVLETFLYSGLRLKGLMNDPNYFAVVQVTVLVYLTRAGTINRILRYIGIGFIIIAIIASGSKTGAVTLACYLVFRAGEHLLHLPRMRRGRILQIITLSLAVLLMPIAITMIYDVFTKLTPAFMRIQSMISSPLEALSIGGSRREDIWRVAIDIINASPILGVGVGTYTDISMMRYGSGSVAHNTYLQLMAEWGVPLTVVFLGYVSVVVVKATKLHQQRTTSLILRDMLLVLLVGSIGLSLNNARMFWFFLGGLSALIQRNKINVG